MSTTDYLPIKTGGTGRRLNGQFEEGNCANPRGRPKGALGKATLLARALLGEQAEALTRKVIDQALDGNVIALRLCLQRLIPVPRDAHITVELPDASAASENMPRHLMEVHDAVIRAVAEGELTPIEGQLFSEILDVRRRTYETTELAERLSHIEERLENKSE